MFRAPAAEAVDDVVTALDAWRVERRRPRYTSSPTYGHADEVRGEVRHRTLPLADALNGPGAVRSQRFHTPPLG